MKYSYLFLICCLLTAGLSGCVGKCEKPDLQIGEQPLIYPDYVGVTFPVNIAPPNFVIKEEGDAFQAEIGCGEKADIVYTGRSPEVIIPLKDWKALLQKASGKEIFIRVTVRRGDKWTQYGDITNSISTSSIDSYLAYRLLYPGYELWNEMGIYQRDLESYEETPVVENRTIGKQCINCHTFAANSPETMMLHVRGKSGGTVIYRNGQIEKVNTKAAGMSNAGTYPAWHPNKRYIAFSVNEIQQFFHSGGQKPVEVSDLAADLVVYDTEKYQLFTDSVIYGKHYMETFPNWSPDGKTLYFCRADAYTQGAPLDSIRYDLYKIAFDAEDHSFGTPICVYAASEHHKSVSFPRVSPDGRYLMFTMSDYGNFSIWHPESELCLLTLDTGEVRVMNEVNSDNVESFHTWSSDGKWFVFSSKRLDGLWARPYFASFDAKTGMAGKPFILPQKDPLFYDSFTRTYNLPELITSPILIGDKVTKIVEPSSLSCEWKR